MKKIRQVLIGMLVFLIAFGTPIGAQEEEDEERVEKREGLVSDIYGGDESEWKAAKEQMRGILGKGGIILTVYHRLPCEPKPQNGRGMTGFMVARDKTLRPSISAPKSPFKTPTGMIIIPYDFKCGPDSGTGNLYLYLNGKIIRLRGENWLRFDAFHTTDCVFISDFPQWDPAHGKKCFTDFKNSFQFPMKNGYVLDVGGAFSFALEIVTK